ncbi:MAG TPA: hypothetical protein VHA09_02880 [Nitrososphaera sp.]|nr:hypothetical protein [Nitrososphaera sp.]
MFAADASSERATNIEDYQNTCTEFIADISRDYKDWVDRYQLGEQEAARRKNIIDDIVKTTNDWIKRFGTTIKKIDIIMNDGVSKMAENTAGYPFGFEGYVLGKSRYATHPVGEVRVNVKATPRPGRLVRVGDYQKDEILLLNASAQVSVALSRESKKGADILDDYIVIDAKKCQRGDVLSLTVIAEEMQDDYVAERRGYSMLVLLT